MSEATARVPVRTILATIGLVLATILTVALYPVVNWVQRHMTWRRRSLATLVMFLGVTLVLGGLLTAFAVPLATQSTTLAGQLPGIITDARLAAVLSVTCSNAPTPCSSCRTTRHGSASSPPGWARRR